MYTLDEYCKILKVNRLTSTKKIETAYKKMAIKYHPSLPINRGHIDRFVAIYLAYDLLSKINIKRTGRYKTREELFQEWTTNEKQNAIEKANELARLKMVEFEMTIFTGLSKTIKLTYGIILVIATIAMTYPIMLYIEGEMSLLYLLIISLAYTSPLFISVFRAIQHEDKISGKIKLILKPKTKFKFFISPNINKSAKDPRSIQDF